MDAKDKKDLDRILSFLYKGSSSAWYNIYTSLKLDKARADHLFKIGFAFDYLQIEHKGALEYPTDNHYVGITSAGIRFFSLSNFSGTERTEEENSEPQKFNVYIGGSNGGFNLLDVDAQQLQIVVDAYLEAKPDFTIVGQTYHPKKFHSLKIFANNSGKSTRELKEIGLTNGSKQGFRGRFFNSEDLEEFGEDLTYSVIGNAQPGSGRKKGSTSVQLDMGTLPVANHSEAETEASTDNPIFISYSWDSRNHEEHVISFANELRKNGFHVDIDKIISQRKTATNFNQMMHEAFLTSEFIIVVLSKGYKEKADTFKGGVGIEYRLILGEIDRHPKKYILVSFNGRDADIIPLGLDGRDIIDINSNGMEPLFRKLTDQHEFVLSSVSKQKPILTQRAILPFEQFQKQFSSKPSSEAEKSSLIAERIQKKNKLKKDFAKWLHYKKEDVKRRFRMIIHSSENDTYPEQPMIENVPPTWFGAEIHGASHLGMEFCNENTQIYVNDKNKWRLEPASNFEEINVSVIKTIVYDDIIAWDMEGDGIYNCPHFYVNFTNGLPWKDIYYINSKKPYMRFDTSNRTDQE
ncbi:SEFIR domain-containing protein [Pedobacter xixiisoli]|uniref:SEFIR domain-containing protein n=2 Tax=Pedobacter xixiisoli TaxID=1476464 RepID=A0A285ZWA2_9SPHI|nr:SEFIR domain-containing protein [Pedobacter xixiisoli]